MIRPILPPFSRAIRRARERISVGLRPGVSSMYRGLSFSRLTAEVNRGQSSSSSLPLRTLVWSIRPSEDSIRMASASAGISILNTRMGVPVLIRAFSTIFIAKVVLPIEGRPATIIRSAGCIPEVWSSRSRKPVVRPVVCSPDSNSSSMRLRVVARIGLMAFGPEPSLLRDSAI